MNSTFAVHEQAILPAVSGVAVIVTSIAIYWIARRWGAPKEGENFRQKLYIIQSIVSAFLIGQIGGHVTIFSDLFPITYGYIFLLGGLWFLRLVESVGRGWNPVKGERLTATEESDYNDFDVNPKTMEQESYISMNNIGSKEAAEKEWKAQDKRRSNAKRVWMMYCLMASFTVVAVMNGFILIVRNAERTAVIICFIVNAIAQTVAVLGGSIHAGYHVTEERKFRILLWGLLTFIWFAVIVCSVIPVLLNMTVSTASTIINTPYFSAIYLFAVGCLWRLSYYYEKQLYIFRSRKQIAMDALVFTLALSISAVTGYWL